MSQPETNRNLLFAIMAVQMDFVPRDAIVSAVLAWTEDKDIPLGQLLADRGELSTVRRNLLDQLLDEHIKAHSNDAARSLQALSSTDGVANLLTRVPDAQFQASLGHLRDKGRTQAGSDDILTNVPTPGEVPTHVPADAGPNAAWTTPLAPWGNRFRVVRKHAEGGLGVVSVAIDDELDREVAYKEIKPKHADHRKSQARFVMEAEITGKLEHPGIVPIYGLGHDPLGRPYYAMRFIQGDSLAEAINRFHDPDGPFRDPGLRTLQLRELLGRFLDVCDALSYAHSRGVLHRDLKPGNIMLGPFGETLVVDWGLALPLDEIPQGVESTLGPLKTSKTDSSSLPGEQGEVVGTPQYMPPEQAEGAIDQLGPRSDVYGLGAILYDLLTGHHPIQGETKSDILAAVRQGRIRPLRHVRPEVPLALEAICLKALSLRPDDRYAHSRALATDIKSWLADEPVSAYREPAIDRARRWARRRRVLVTGVAASLIVGLVGLGAVAIVQARASRDLMDANLVLDQQRLRAEDREQQAIDAVKKFRDAVFNEPLVMNTKDLEALRRRLLKEPLAFFNALRQRLQVDYETRPESLARLADAALALGTLTNAIGDTSDAILVYEEARKCYYSLVAQNPTVTAYRSALASSHNELGLLLSNMGKPDAALKAYEQAREIREALVAQHPTASEYQNDLAGSHNNIGNLLSNTGKPDAARKAYEQAQGIREALVAQHPTASEYQIALARSYNNMGLLLYRTGKPDAALEAYERSREIRKTLAAQHPDTSAYQSALASIHNNIGVLLSETGKSNSAIKEHEQAQEIRKTLVAQHPTVNEYLSDLAGSHLNIGNTLSDTGKPDAALKAYEQAREIQKTLVAQNPTSAPYKSTLAGSHINIGNLLLALGKTDDALKAFEQGREIQKTLVAQNPTSTAYQSGLAGGHNNIGGLLSATGKPHDALKAYEQAREIQRILVAQNPSVSAYQSELAGSYYNIGNILSATGKPDARKAFEQAREIQMRLVSELPENTEYLNSLGGILNNLALVDLNANRFSEARQGLREAVNWQKKALAAIPSNLQYRQFLKNHLINLRKACQKLDDRNGLAEAERELKALADSDPALIALDARLTAILAGKGKPKDTIERLRLGLRAYNTSRHAAAARLWDEALTVEPRLANDRDAGVRYDAARAAALAGTGQGKDDPTPGEGEKARLRGKALGWLREELKAWEKVLNSNEGKETVGQTLRHWTQDADLAGVREPASLAKLQEAERKEWEGLWKDVERLRARAK